MAPCHPLFLTFSVAVPYPCVQSPALVGYPETEPIHMRSPKGPPSRIYTASCPGSADPDLFSPPRHHLLIIYCPILCSRTPILTMSTNETSTAANATKPTPSRKLSVDLQTVETLEKRLTQRPDKKDLVDRNILKDDKIAPSLQAAKEKLERSQLEDKLGHALQQRPKREELEQQGILKPDASTPTTASA